MHIEKITSRKNPKIVFASSLSDKKNRDKSGLFAVEGIKLSKELLSEKLSVTEVYVTEKAEERYADFLFEASESGAKLYSVTDEVYGKLTEEQNPEGIFCIAEKFRVYDDVRLVPGYEDGGFLILDEIQNPQNLGAVIRTASALGIAKILIGPGSADIFGKKTLRSAMGTLFKVSLCESRDLCRDIELLKKSGHICAAALADDACDIRKYSFSESDSIVLGNEGRGISEKVLDLCNVKVIIPMKLGTESLNAASAAAIFMWEKQKGTSV